MSIRKNKSTRKNISDLKMCFLVDLFFLVKLFFLINFLHEAALNFKSDVLDFKNVKIKCKLCDIWDLIWDLRFKLLLFDSPPYAWIT